MKASDADILIIPGYTNSGPSHWQSRWEAKLSAARRVEQARWTKPVREDWIARIAEEVNASTRPVVLVAHSLGVPSVIHAIPHFRNRVAGAFLVAPADVANPDIRPKHLMTLAPIHAIRCPFRRLRSPAATIRSAATNMPTMSPAVRSFLVDAGEAGISMPIRDGPWPEGTMVFASSSARSPPIAEKTPPRLLTGAF